MDTLTHTVLGACMGQAIAGRQLGKKAMLIGVIVNNLPDIDVIAQAATSPAKALLVHRGITHSIFLNVILLFLLAYLVQRLYSKHSISYRRSLLLVGSGLFLHIFLDALTSYGTGWFEPFNHARVSFNTLFILDPLLLLPLLITAIALLILKRDASSRMMWARTGLSISLVYLLLTFCIKIYVNQAVSKDLSDRHIPHTDYMTSPGPLNNLLWYCLVKNKKEYYTGYYSVFDHSTAVDYETIPKNDSLLKPYLASPEVQRLIRFSQDYYQVGWQDSNLVFSDLRFGQAGGWYKKNMPFVFSYNIVGQNRLAQLQQSRFKSLEPGALSSLWKRIGGEK